MRTSTFIYVLISTFIALFISGTAKSQNWVTIGNQINGTDWFGADNQSTIPVRLQHQANIGANSRFEWYTNNGTLAERMRLTNNGELGLNITNPSARLHIHNGTLLATGVLGTNPNLGAGTRLMWIPDKAAFRAGEILNNDWDGTQVGYYSMAFGYSNLASGTASAVCGYGNSGVGDGTFVAGINNAITGNLSTAFGDSNEIGAEKSLASGVDNQIIGGNGNTALGYANRYGSDQC